KESSFTYQERINNSQEEGFETRIAPAGFGTTYRSLVDSIQIKNFDVYGKKYHSLDSLKKWKWEITNETKTILGYEVRKAITEDEYSTITAWYSPKIPVFNGPAEFWGLPGLILEVVQESKQMAYKAVYIAEFLKENKKIKVIKPDQGIQI